MCFVVGCETALQSTKSAIPPQRRRKAAAAGGGKKMGDCLPKDDTPSGSKRTTSLENYIKATVGGNKVVIFSKTTCSYCAGAKKTFKKIGCTPTIIELDKSKDGRAIQTVLGNMTGRTTVPNVFVGGEAIGGGSETTAAYKSGRLLKMLQKCGAIVV